MSVRFLSGAVSSLALTRYSFTSKLYCGSQSSICCPPTCKAYPITILLHAPFAIYAPPHQPPLCMPYAHIPYRPQPSTATLPARTEAHHGNNLLKKRSNMDQFRRFRNSCFQNAYPYNLEEFNQPSVNKRCERDRLDVGLCLHWVKGALCA